MRRLGPVLGGVAAVAAGLAALFGPWGGDVGPRLASEASVRARGGADRLPVLVLLEPGTIVGSGPPPGWSDAVMKTVTHLAAGDLETLPAMARVSATRFRTVILADVSREPGLGHFVLRRVGAGLGTIRDGKETIISTESLTAQGVALSTLDRMVLGRAEKTVGRSRLAARTPTFALYDSFVQLADEAGAHRSIVLRYALVVEPGSGRLRTACWSMAEEATGRREPESLILLPSNLVFRCGIHVSARRLIGNFAASWGFAMTELPTGEVLRMPPALRGPAIRDPERLDPEALEQAVREALGDRRPPAQPLPR